MPASLKPNATQKTAIFNIVPPRACGYAPRLQQAHWAPGTHCVFPSHLRTARTEGPRCLLYDTPSAPATLLAAVVDRPSDLTLEIGPPNDAVDITVFQQELAGLKAGRQFHANRGLDRPRP